ncbi:MAG: hypothetical protein U9Q81_20610 [Pseudomonadota bacterium]|nr:hypothetical protein [Pseudomonadota bacterium]
MAYDATSFLATLLHWYGIPKARWFLGERTNHAPTFEAVLTRAEPRKDRPSFTPPYDRNYPPDGKPTPRTAVHDLHLDIAHQIVVSMARGKVPPAQVSQLSHEVTDGARDAQIECGSGPQQHQGQARGLVQAPARQQDQHGDGHTRQPYDHQGAMKNRKPSALPLRGLQFVVGPNLERERSETQSTPTEYDCEGNPDESDRQRLIRRIRYCTPVGPAQSMVSDVIAQRVPLPEPVDRRRQPGCSISESCSRTITC